MEEGAGQMTMSVTLHRNKEQLRHHTLNQSPIWLWMDRACDELLVCLLPPCSVTLIAVVPKGGEEG